MGVIGSAEQERAGDTPIQSMSIVAICSQLSHIVGSLTPRGSESDVESSIQKVLFSWPVLLVFHFFVAAAGGMLIGFIPEALLAALLQHWS